MRIVVTIVVFICAAIAFPQDDDHLRFKNLYVDSIRSSPASTSITARITHGTEAIPHSIPYQAYVKIIGFYLNWLCGGSLISPKYVLTAGHCVEGGIVAEVHLGAHNVQEKEDTQVLAVGYNLILHEGYDADSVTNDIGLIELTEAVQLNRYINVAKLPYNGDRNTYEGYTARVSGWGRTSGTAPPSPVLLQANGTVIANRVCGSFFSVIQDHHICTAGDHGVGTCNGDSGGPLVAGNTLVGIVSFGVRKCVEGFPSGYTRITSFLEWIKENSDL